jgi:hypothetical protein
MSVNAVNKSYGDRGIEAVLLLSLESEKENGQENS